MPNYVMNQISVQGDPKEIQSMLEQIKNDDFGIGTVDFDKIIPMPKSLDIESGTRTENGLKAYRQFIKSYTSGKTARNALKSLRNIPLESENAFLCQRPDISREEWDLGKAAWHNLQDYGAATWYDWCVSNWGTKWNAYGYEKGVDYSGNDSLCFRTAWSAPHPVLDKLSEMYPEIVMEHRWADEDIGCNCGQRTRLGGKIIDEYIPEGVRTKDFAMEMWGYEPAELGVCLNASGTGYIYVDDTDFETIELLGQPALFTNERLTNEDIPQGMYCYHLRHGDDGQFCTVEPRVSANHGGSVITKEPIDFGKEGYISFTEETSPNFTGESMTLEEFMRDQSPQEGEVMKLC